MYGDIKGTKGFTVINDASSYINKILINEQTSLVPNSSRDYFIMFKTNLEQFYHNSIQRKLE